MDVLSVSVRAHPGARTEKDSTSIGMAVRNPIFQIPRAGGPKVDLKRNLDFDPKGQHERVLSFDRWICAIHLKSTILDGLSMYLVICVLKRGPRDMIECTCFRE